VIIYPSRNWLGVIFRLRGTVLLHVALRTVITAAIAAVAVYLKRVRGIDLGIPTVVHTIIGAALGLLLVFRTNASYDRFWEGRKILGGITNHCRDLARQAACYLADAEARARAGRLIVALHATFRRALRRERELGELDEHLGAETVKKLAAEHSPALVVSCWLTDVFVAKAAAGELSEERLRSVDTSLTNLIGLWGAAERIVKTPVPFAYAHHIKLFLTLFCFTVPFALVETSSWYAVVGAAAVAFGMFGIDEIGVEIEDPFGYDENDLPLDQIGAAVAADVLSITLNAHEGDPAPD
jgi:putative membrane protein